MYPARFILYLALAMERDMSTNNLVHRLVSTTCLLASSALWAQEESIPLADVPAAAIAAAEAAVEGLQIASAEVEVERGQTVYELEGTVDGTEYEIEVTADGQVLELETDD